VAALRRRDQGAAIDDDHGALAQQVDHQHVRASTRNEQVLRATTGSREGKCQGDSTTFRPGICVPLYGIAGDVVRAKPYPTSNNVDKEVIDGHGQVYGHIQSHRRWMEVAIECTHGHRRLPP
jgi:hypothetical protein